MLSGKLNGNGLFPAILPKHREDFYRKRFIHNSISILIFSVYLTLEQLYYAIYVRESGSLLQRIHLVTFAIMLLFAVLSAYVLVKREFKLSLAHKVYEMGFGICGFSVAVARALVTPNSDFSLPTIYIAVIYGFAAIFYFSPAKSFMIYMGFAAVFIVQLPNFQPHALQGSYVQDVISNSAIAWMLSAINYQRYVMYFINQKIIDENNRELNKKTSEIQSMNRILEHMSITDGLTRLYNRRKLDEILNQQYQRSNKCDVEFSVIIMDIDFFKRINDTYGHGVGDRVLEQTAQILKNNARNLDVGRWGGEEFLVICPQTGKEEASHISEQLRTKIEQYEFEGVGGITASFGVATYRRGDTVKDLVRRADERLYSAKRNGRNRIEFMEEGGFDFA